MSAPIGKGDWVECIDNRSEPGCQWRPGEQLTMGAIYQVADCFLDEEEYPCVELVGRPRAPEFGFRRGYWVNRFRPIWRGDEATIHSALEPAPAREPESV